jgi:RNA polymerase sigma factor for flagellar operon FliA
VKFETFAVPRIRGAVFDGLRSLDWVPRSVRSRAREVEGAFQELEGKLGRAPTDEEMSAHLKITAAEFQKWLAAIASTTVGPLDRALVAGAEPRALDRRRARFARSDGGGDARSSASCASSCVACPSGRSSCCRCTTTRASRWPRSGRCSGVTESRVSQIHTKAVLHLRARLSATGVA